MTALIARLGPYAKPLVILTAIIVAIVAQWAGVDLGLDVDQLWTAFGAAVLAFLVPAPGYRAPGESDPQVRANLQREAP